MFHCRKVVFITSKKHPKKSMFNCENKITAIYLMMCIEQYDKTAVRIKTSAGIYKIKVNTCAMLCITNN